MKTIVGIIGIDQYEKLTLPALRSIEPWCDVVVMDNGSDPPYPKALRVERTSYADAINILLTETFAHHYDWCLVVNNDVLCTGDILQIVKPCDPLTLYGNKLRRQNGVEWVDTWCLLISKQAFGIVGRFDKRFEMVGFEDADYCIRAKAKGIGVALASLPLIHLADSSRWNMKGYEKQRVKNMKLLHRKHGITLDANAEVVQ